MAYDGESLVATAIERLNENMMRMDERQQKYQEKTDSKLEKMSELLGKLVYIDTELKESTKRIHHRIDEVEKRVVKMEDTRVNGGCPVFKEHLAHLDGLNIGERLEAIEQKGTKRWEAVIIKVLEWGVLFVLASVALRFGVKV